MSQKKYSGLILLCFAILFVLNACKKEFDTTAPGQEITVVYGLLDKNDTRHYIRIQKAFLDKNKNAYEMAKESDSIYYGNQLVVKLTDLNTNAFFTLSRANGDTLGMSKDSGIFSNSPNVLYAFNGTLIKDHAYRLSVENTSTGNIATSTINIVNEPKLIYPFNNLTNFSMIDTTAFSIRFNSGKYGRVYDLNIRFNYSEWDISTPTIISYKSVSYIAARGLKSVNLNGSELMETSIQRSDFFRQLKILIPFDPTKQRKASVINSLQFMLYAGGDELYKYVQVKNAQGGLTSSSILPVYTNVENGLGLFSSRTMVEAKNISFNGDTHDSIRVGYYTKDLNFVP